jgi:deoxyribonuclease V
MVVDGGCWPTSSAPLAERQAALAAARPPPWFPSPGLLRACGVALVSRRGARGAGAAGDPGVAAAVTLELGGAGPREVGRAVVAGVLPAAFEPGLLALREGPLLEAVVRALAAAPDVVLVHAAGRDHPRSAGLAVMLGAALGLPTVGVTSRPLVARGEEPADAPGSRSALVHAGEVVAYWLRTRTGARPIVAHGAWRTTAAHAAEVVLRAAAGMRMPEPLRRATELARRERDGTLRPRA